MTNKVDRKVEELIAAGVEIKFPNSVIIDKTVEIQAGVVIHHGVVITGGTKIFGPTIIWQGSLISESIIEEGCEIGLASQVKDCQIGASTKVGSGVEIIRSRTCGQSSIGNQSYVRNSDIGEGSKIGQLCFID